mgnify:CR=1 FL=1
MKELNNNDTKIIYLFHQTYVSIYSILNSLAELNSTFSPVRFVYDTWISAVTFFLLLLFNILSQKFRTIFLGIFLFE